MIHAHRVGARGAYSAGASSPDTRGPAPRPESHLPPGSGAAHRLGRNSQRLPSARGLSLVPSSPAVSSCSPQLSHLWGDAWGHWRTAGSHPLHPSQARFLGLGFLGTVEKPAPKRWSQVYNFTVFFGYSSSVSITKSQIYLCPIFEFPWKPPRFPVICSRGVVGGPLQPGQLPGLPGRARWAGDWAGQWLSGEGEGAPGQQISTRTQSLTGVERGYFPHHRPAN